MADYIRWHPIGEWKNLPDLSTPASAEFLEHIETGVFDAQRRADDAYALAEAGSGVGVTDGDKGEVTVSGTGSVWEVNNTHAGTTHAAVQAAAEAAAAADATTKADAAQAFAIQRANHTGAQATSTVTGLDAALAAKMDLTTAQSVTAGIKKSFAHDATTAGFRLVPSVSVPSGIAVGDFWYNGVSSRLYYGGFSSNIRYMLNDADVVQDLLSPSATTIPSTAAIATLGEVVAGTYTTVTPAAGPTLIVDLEAITAAKALPLVVRAASAQVMNASTTITADAELTVAVVANAVYEVFGYIYYDSSTTADFKMQFRGPAAATFNYIPGGIHGSGTTFGDFLSGVTAIGTGNTIGVAGAGVGTNMLACPRGILTTSATAGNFVFWWAQFTSDATNTTRQAGSTLVLRRIV